ncbi:calcium/proton exchanger [Paenibacillus chartarius]|uniref:Ca(2+)/H(+) antiporter n=1 Tax=Paenibacillus chartarius TaxID=747481 RepID=A0ABV6DKM6_9BACL
MRAKLFYLGLIASFIASGALHYLHADSTLQFVVSCAAIIFVAGFLGKATESVAHYAGERLGGFLNATFGNAAELIIAIFLVRDGLFDMVKASLTGSIIGNLLLVLGLSVLAGGLKFKEQTFNVKLASHNASLMFLAIIALVIPAVFSRSFTIKETNMLSIFVAALLIIAYLLWLLFSMVTHKTELADQVVAGHAEEEHPAWSAKLSVFLLLLATVMTALVSEWLVGTVHEFSAQFGLSELFIGAFLIAIIGNAAEHSAAVFLALKNKMGAAVEIAVGSSLQIALFVAPVLVIASWMMGNPMDLVFTFYELAAITVAVLIAKSISQDGQSNWYEGVLLLVVYLILGIAFFLV